MLDSLTSGLGAIANAMIPAFNRGGSGLAGAVAEPLSARGVDFQTEGAQAIARAVPRFGAVSEHEVVATEGAVAAAERNFMLYKRHTGNLLKLGQIGAQLAGFNAQVAQRIQGIDGQLQKTELGQAKANYLHGLDSNAVQAQHAAWGGGARARARVALKRGAR